MRILRLTFLVAIIAGFVGLSSCKEDKSEDPTIEEAQLKLLSKTWTVKEIRFGAGNTDRTSDYQGMTLTVSGSFNSNNEYDYSRSTLTKIGPWPKSGKWSFSENDPANLVLRHDIGGDVQMTYSVTKDQLQLSFTYTGAGEAGRVSAVEGNWVFLFE